MKRVLALICVSIAFSAAAQERMHLTQTCDIRARPTAAAAAVCRGRKGDWAEVVAGPAPGFVHVRLGRCLGYLPRACATTAPATFVARNSRRPASDDVAAQEMSNFAAEAGLSGAEIEVLPWRIGVDTGGDFAIASVPYAGALSTGFGAGVGVRIEKQFRPRLRASLAVSYRMVRLGRSLDGTGSIEDPSPASYVQTLGVVGIRADAAYRMGERAHEVHWWLEGGVEYLIPVSASQMDAAGNEVSFSSPDKPLLILVGPAADFSLGDSFQLWLSLRPFYNVLAVDSRLFGARLGVAVTTAL